MGYGSIWNKIKNLVTLDSIAYADRYSLPSNTTVYSYSTVADGKPIKEHLLIDATTDPTR